MQGLRTCRSSLCRQLQYGLTIASGSLPVVVGRVGVPAAVDLVRPGPQTQTVRHGTGKHYDPKWRKQRALKFIKVYLPDFDKQRKQAKMTPEEMRSDMKRRGKLPPRSHSERNLVLASTGDIFEPYVPPEGDGLASAVSAEGAKQRLTEVEKKGKSFLQLRKVRQYEAGFDPGNFAEDALSIYVDAQKLLENIKENEEKLHDLVTEKAYPEMTWNMDKKTIRWEFIKSLEAPRVVHVRTTDLLTKDNIYGQVTVRLHTQQTLAIYDRFGRLMYGSEMLAKNVLEYIVFEKHLSDEYGTWRIHGKVVPDWMPQRQAVVRTVRLPPKSPQNPDGQSTDTDNSSSERTVATA